MALSISVQVFAFDESRGRREGVSSRGKNYLFFEQQAVVDGGANQPPIVVRVQHDNRSDVLAPGMYNADLMLSADQYGALRARLDHFRLAQGKPQAVAG
ncbi:MAG: hypothetical protein M1488_02250 [Gammaproteobacteria bacterium]|nr:hypothetical protein [Gammaproteobacteria bacterium]